MTPQQAYEVWAPPDARWSQWAKPILFAHIGRIDQMERSIELPPTPTAQWAPAADGQVAIVLDVPGSFGVQLAIELARRGFRPVPLYNALPGDNRGPAICNVIDILTTMVAVTGELRAISIPQDAPPAFMLDADRRTGTGEAPSQGIFDNRSVSLPTDFPSSNRLLAHGIHRIVLVQLDQLQPQPDLSHTLLRWQEAGIMITSVALNRPEAPQPIQVRRPRWYHCAWQRMLASAGLRRSPMGGSGGFLPAPSAG